LRDVPPFSGWPKDLAAVIHGYVGYVDGGLHIDGSEEAPVAHDQVLEHCQQIRKLGISAIAIVGVYSPIDVDHHQEDVVRQLILQHLPQAHVVCSHEVANIGKHLKRILERRKTLC
jgi:N-methylhydantoinase A/oxoprolinase/acetone carboxylase beta subunit